MDSSHSQSSDLHSKLQLVAEDVRFLKQQFKDAAEAKIDVNLDCDKNDPVRKRVDEIVQQFISDTFEMSKHAMIIDGEEMGDKDLSVVLERDDDVEPFDLALNDRLRQLYAQVDEKTLEVTQLRRTVPFEAIQVYSNNKLDPKSLSINETDENNTNNNDDENEEIQKENYTLSNRAQMDYTNALTLLSNLKQKVPDELIELEKLEQTINYLSATSSTTASSSLSLSNS